MMIALQTVFWISVIGLAYIFAGYPLLVWFCALKFRKPVTNASQPRKVSVVIVAHNEARNLPRKLTSILACVRSEWIEEILIGSDGSTDDTVQVLEQFPDPRVHVIDFKQRRGKPSVLNDLIPRCKGDIVLLADSRQDFDSRCVEKLLANFEDPKIGVVSGELVLRSQAGESTAAKGIGFYWKYEKFIRKCESGFRGVPGATGACYAIRKSLFQPIPEQTILDDVAIPMQAVVQGYRCLFEPLAMIYDLPSGSTKQESIRKRRTIAGAAQLIRLYPSWIWPTRNPIWLEFVSHKLLRLVSPLLLVAALLTNACLLEFSAYRILLILQIAFYTAAAIGWLYQFLGRKAALFGAPLMFVTLNLTTVLALWDAARSRYRVTWQK